jgi:hypothetical protein
MKDGTWAVLIVIVGMTLAIGMLVLMIQAFDWALRAL